MTSHSLKKLSYDDESTQSGEFDNFFFAEFLIKVRRENQSNVLKAPRKSSRGAFNFISVQLLINVIELKKQFVDESNEIELLIAF